MSKICVLWLEMMESECGGAVSHLTGFLDAVKKKHDVFVVSTKKYSYLKDYHVLELGQKFNAFFTRSVYYNYQIYQRIRNTIAREKPDFIYQRHVGYTYLGAKLAKDLKIPLFLEFNSSLEWIIKQGITGWRKYAFKVLMPIINYYERKSLKGATKIFTVSNASKRQLLNMGIPEQKIVVNPNGVDIDKFNPTVDRTKIREKYLILQNDIVVGFLGTFGKWHGAEVLAKTANQIVKNNKDIHFLFIGDGNYRKYAETIIGMNNQVQFTGLVPREEVPEYLSVCDILINPTMPNPDGSEFIGSPTKLFEYMAVGKAIISSNIGQMNEILIDKEDVLFFEAGNINQLNASIIYLSKDKFMRKKLGRNARTKAIENYTWDKNAKRVLDEYDNL